MKEHRKLWKLTALVAAIGILGSSKGYACAQENNAAQIPNPGVTFTENVSANSYSRARYDFGASTIKSYLFPNEDGTLTRLEYYNGEIFLEDYYKDLRLLNRNSGRYSIPMELELFGGAFVGEKYNWIVFGQNNLDESNEVETYRIVKYSKDWERLDDCRIYGANTRGPFAQGNCRMAEYNGNLFIRTCHTMYKSADGANHQANAILKIDEQTMVYSGLAGFEGGHVSHSFDQFVDITDGQLTAVDLGDKYPRAIVWFKYEAGAADPMVLHQWTSSSNVLPIAEADNSEDSFAYNATGVSIGGYQVSADHYLVAYSSVDQFSASSAIYQTGSEAPRNIYVAAMPRNGQSDTWETVQITDYAEGQAYTPQFIKIADDKYLLIWEYVTGNQGYEYYYNNRGTFSLKYCLINGAGKRLSQIYTWNSEDNARLSDCVPVMWNGKVVWYTCDMDKGLRFYTIDFSGAAPVTQMKTIAESHHHVYPEKCSYDDKYHWKECTECHEIAPDNVWAKSEHMRGDWIVDREATREEPGIKHQECAYEGCDYVFETAEIPRDTSGMNMDDNPSKHFDLTRDEGTWDGTYYYLSNGQKVRNAFFCDGTYTYYLQADGTPMRDRLTYHPDGEHVIYFDQDGHEVFSNFANVTMSIAGTPVDDMCFFNVYGYMYVDTLTYDKTGTMLYYVNPYGVLERNGWFQFSGNEFDAGLGFFGTPGGYGYANSDCSLMTSTYTYDWNGNFVYIQADGHVQ